MKIVLYYQSGSLIGRYMEASIDASPFGFEKVICHSLENLEWTIRQPSHGGAALVVLVVSGEDELCRLESMRKLLYRCRIVVVLPHRDDAVTSRAHALRPRYVTFSDTVSNTTAAVIFKMAHRATDGM